MNKRIKITHIPQVHDNTFEDGMKSEIAIVKFIINRIFQLSKHNKKLIIFYESPCMSDEYKFLNNPGKVIGYIHELEYELKKFKSKYMFEISRWDIPSLMTFIKLSEDKILKRKLIYYINKTKEIEALKQIFFVIYPVIEELLKRNIRVQDKIIFIPTPCLRNLNEKQSQTHIKIQKSFKKLYRNIRHLIQKWKLNKKNINERNRKCDELDIIFKSIFEEYCSKDYVCFNHYLLDYVSNINQFLKKEKYIFPKNFSATNEKRFKNQLKKLLSKNVIMNSREYLSIIQIIEYIDHYHNSKNEYYILYGSQHDFEYSWNDVLQEKKQKIFFERSKNKAFEFQKTNTYKNVQKCNEKSLRKSIKRVDNNFYDIPQKYNFLS